MFKWRKQREPKKYPQQSTQRAKCWAGRPDPLDVATGTLSMDPMDEDARSKIYLARIEQKEADQGTQN